MYDEQNEFSFFATFNYYVERDQATDWPMDRASNRGAMAHSKAQRAYNLHRHGPSTKTKRILTQHGNTDEAQEMDSSEKSRSNSTWPTLDRVSLRSGSLSPLDATV